MPEIGEVARIVHFIRKHLVGKTLTKVTANVDDIVYGKVGTSAAEFEKHMSGKKVVDAGQQGKYFWMIMSSPPHPVMHFGMSGWFKIKSEHTYYYRKKEDEEPEDWPPKYTKFLLEAKGDNGVEEAAFVDARRLARIRLVDCDGKQIRKHSPLKENGPDPVIDKDIVTLQWLTEKCNKKKVPIKAMLLDQAVISGVGNWVGDEIMYHAKMHPEQYANTLQDSQIEQLHKSLHYVCGLACELLADSDRFPDDWLFKHRWGKGKKGEANILPNGNKIEFLTVGGRTSAVVPAVQKKTGPVAKDIGDDTAVDAKEVDKKPKKAAKQTTSRKRKTEADEEEEEDSEQSEHNKRTKTSVVKARKAKKVNSEEPKKTSKRGKKAQDVKDEQSQSDEELPKKVPVRSKKTETAKNENEKDVAQKPVKSAAKEKSTANSKKTNGVTEEEDSGRRRSSRLKK